VVGTTFCAFEPQVNRHSLQNAQRVAALQ